MPRYLQLAALLPALLLLVAADAPSEKAATSYLLKSTEIIDPDVVIIPAAEDRKLAGHIKAFTDALQKTKPKYPANLAINLITAGPPLASPDEVTIGKLERQENKLSLKITYTSTHVRGVQLRRNVPWTPLVFELLPSDLPPGQYTLSVTWHCSDEPAAGVKKPDDIALQTKFELTRVK